ncbi:hypothetical protein BN946_scf184994.g21 [Trametes cinnabarina]|uniref:Tyrosine specific protein phosphatases domain-containing protein n=1 Tax=Pycnoporus cinnabarinus TaxID=5643 RepID=A0A060SK13_PYCCI|nr:hypothetical protein BN946_scf184994.g21 [Trametes cinnabarina]
MAKSLKLPSFVWVHPSVRRAFLGNTGSFRDLSGKRPRPASFEATSATPYSHLRQDGHDRPRVLRIASSPAVPQLGPPIPSSGLQDLSAANRGNPSQLHATTIAAAPAITMPDGSSAPPLGTARLIGNLYMSSCPGKKGLVDLSEVVVRCLDDSELQTLGVTWPEYRQVAGEFGIDILRIPIPEGLPPNDPAALDSHLSKLIDAYTLRGSAVLVHCRGGVGRAGIIAACWALKLGLCGWLDIQDPPFQHAELDEANSVSDRTVAPNFNTMRLVERLIAVVRRRRSPKAIETYEQVKFLVDFVEYLREQAEPTRRNATIDWFADWDVRVE